MNSQDKAAKKQKSVWNRLQFPAVIGLIFLSAAILLWSRTGKIFFLFDLGYIGCSLALGIGLYALLPKQKKPIGRRLAQVLVGVYMTAFLGLLVKQNMQLEGLFFCLFQGVFGGAIIHYTIAKLIGPLIFGRGFCGWACWTAMVLDLLPWRRGRGWLPGGWKWMRLAVLGASAALTAGLVFVVGYRIDDARAVHWMLAGNLLYFTAAIPLAWRLKDNRAFCKYLCPVPMLMKAGGRFSLLKIGGEEAGCNGCGACTRACPMNIDIPRYIQARQRVLSTECILCQTCASVCPSQTLRFCWGWDRGWREFLQIQPDRRARQTRRRSSLKTALLLALVVAGSCLRGMAQDATFQGGQADTTGVKFKMKDYANRVWMRPSAVVSPAMNAAILMAAPPGSGATQYPPQWREGAGGFARNFGDQFAQRQSFFTARLAGNVIFRENPEYDPSLSNHTLVRAAHAVLFTFVDRTDGGRRMPALGNLLGAGASGAVPDLYLPRGYCNRTHMGQRAVLQFSYYGIQNLVTEFSPQLP